MKGQAVLVIVALILIILAGIYSYRHQRIEISAPEAETKPKPSPFYPNLTSPTVVKTPTGTICEVKTFGIVLGIDWESGASIFACVYDAPMFEECEKLWSGRISPGLSEYTFQLDPPLTYTAKVRRVYYICYEWHGPGYQAGYACDLITEFHLCP